MRCVQTSYHLLVVFLAQLIICDLMLYLVAHVYSHFLPFGNKVHWNGRWYPWYEVKCAINPMSCSQSLLRSHPASPSGHILHFLVESSSKCCFKWYRYGSNESKCSPHSLEPTQPNMPIYFKYWEWTKYFKFFILFGLSPYEEVCAASFRIESDIENTLYALIPDVASLRRLGCSMAGISEDIIAYHQSLMITVQYQCNIANMIPSL